MTQNQWGRIERRRNGGRRRSDYAAIDDDEGRRSAVTDFSGGDRRHLAAIQSGEGEKYHPVESGSRSTRQGGRSDSRSDQDQAGVGAMARMIKGFWGWLSGAV